MDVSMAKQLVVRAGRDLVESGLIARTWGNVSCRVDDMSFVVTPSGRSYDTLQPEEVVLCRVADASYEGDIKPSSEKGIHALIYRTYPEINFVIHTHQPKASALSASDKKNLPSGKKKLLGDRIPIAAYGLPGTKTLRKNIGLSLESSGGRAIIMAHHGALCFGKDYEETFLAARQLEEACTQYIANAFLDISGQKAYEETKFFDFYVSIMTKGKKKQNFKPVSLYRSRRLPEGFALIKDTETIYSFGSQLPPEAQIHQSIYLARKDINFICQDTDKSLTAISLTGNPLEPLLDDFAQIVGSSAECAESINTKGIVKALGKRMGVLIPGGGALCCATKESDLHAVCLVMEKDAFTQIAARIVGKGRPISLLDCKLMNFVYKKSYAKKANQ